MSDSCNPRIKRKSGPSGKITKNNYRKKALPHLLVDFDGRCAYSMRHIRASGKTAMHVDHVNPKLTGRARHLYKNLVLAVAQCNGKKVDTWPSKSEIKKGIRFLDPCAEQDYGCHIFEDPATSELVGVTSEGRFHIDMLDLNAETFVWERRLRAAYRTLASSPAQILGSFSDVSAMRADLMKIVTGSIDDLIPPIPAPPKVEMVVGKALPD